MQISEIYVSRQGEGRLTGQSSIFVRTSGCNLRCGFCDTPYTSWQPEGQSMSIDEIVATVGHFKENYVVLTGGEPMLPTGVCELTERVRAQNKHITIETAGTIYREVVCDLMSISPKLSNSTPTESRAGDWVRKHEQARINISVLKKLIEQFDYQLKFVVVERRDLEEIQVLCDSLPGISSDRVMLMPEGIDQQTLNSRTDWIKKACAENGYGFCPRMHIQWYGNRRGT